MPEGPADFEALTETVSIVRIREPGGDRAETSLLDSVIREGRMQVYADDVLLADAPALLDAAEAFACACLFLGSAVAAPDIGAVVPHIKASRAGPACLRVDVRMPAGMALAPPWENLDAIDETSLRKSGLAPLAPPEGSAARVGIVGVATQGVGAAGGGALPIDAIFKAVAALSDEPSLYRRTGGVHSAGLARPDGSLALRFEDISRRSAVDKTIGMALIQGLISGSEESALFLVSSGRICSEFVVRAAKARVSLIASVSAPTDRAVALAESWGVTLCGFVRGKRMNIYTHEGRVLR